MKLAFTLLMVLLAFSKCAHVSDASAVLNLNHQELEFNDSCTVFIFLNTECPICQKYQGYFKSLKKIKEQVYYVFPGQQNELVIQAFGDFDSLDRWTLIPDPEYTLSKKMKASVTPEVIVLKNKKVMYQGKLDDRFENIGSSKPFAHVNYVENALNSLRRNERVKIPYTKAVGCFIEPN